MVYHCTKHSTISEPTQAIPTCSNWWYVLWYHLCISISNPVLVTDLLPFVSKQNPQLKCQYWESGRLLDVAYTITSSHARYLNCVSVAYNHWEGQTSYHYLVTNYFNPSVLLYGVWWVIGRHQRLLTYLMCLWQSVSRSVRVCTWLDMLDVLYIHDEFASCLALSANLSRMFLLYSLNVTDYAAC